MNYYTHLMQNFHKELSCGISARLHNERQRKDSYYLLHFSSTVKEMPEFEAP